MTNQYFNDSSFTERNDYWIRTMKAITSLSTVILLSISSVSHAHSCNSIQSLNWLLGYWETDDDKNTVTELWQKISPLTFEGAGETRAKQTDVLQSSESLRLVEMSDEVFYIAKVDHNKRPITFKLTQCEGMKAVFENHEHDFPKILEYRIGTDNRLTVNVSDGKDKGFNITYTARD